MLLLCVEVRWEEERSTDGSKWRFLQHKGPVFAPQYEVLPDRVRFYYHGTSRKSLHGHRRGRKKTILQEV